PFGFNPLVSDLSNPGNFVGYPELLGHRMNLQAFNASCPGETTMHFISTSGLDDSCGLYRAFFPLHVTYTGSQLDYATTFLASHPVRFVTVMVGALDLSAFACVCAGNPGCILIDIQT